MAYGELSVMSASLTVPTSGPAVANYDVAGVWLPTRKGPESIGGDFKWSGPKNHQKYPNVAKMPFSGQKTKRPYSILLYEHEVWTRRMYMKLCHPLDSVSDCRPRMCLKLLQVRTSVSNMKWLAVIGEGTGQVPFLRIPEPQMAQTVA